MQPKKYKKTIKDISAIRYMRRLQYTMILTGGEESKDISAIRYMRQLQYATTSTGGGGKRPKVEENAAQKKKN
ncbi:hypothetical protein C2G38_2185167 [Gigaspora rosea]|uniref:Uncharacterized protein n=1 Tax=Gigaspora rosea TaxID=44941 RepID=A0A397VE53_9GLOM|nr:hypothetical protein C2G38_2185167 [Gigaspora rosea]